MNISYTDHNGKIRSMEADQDEVSEILKGRKFVTVCKTQFENALQYIKDDNELYAFLLNMARMICGVDTTETGIAIVDMLTTDAVRAFEDVAYKYAANTIINRENARRKPKKAEEAINDCKLSSDRKNSKNAENGHTGAQETRYPAEYYETIAKLEAAAAKEGSKKRVNRSKADAYYKINPVGFKNWLSDYLE